MSDKLTETIRALCSKLGMSEKETDAALKKHQLDRRAYYRKLRDRVKAGDRHLEAEHNRRWFDQEAVKSEAKHKKEKEDHYREILARRKTQSLDFRLQSVLSRAKFYDSRAKSPSLGGTGGPDSEMPLGPFGVFTNQPPTIDLEDSIRVIEKHLERMESRVDSFLGLRSPVSLTEREKRELLSQLKGMHSAEVSASFSELGSQRTIEKWRAEIDPDCRPSTGLPK